MTAKFTPRDPRLFEAALRRFDEENARDPHLEHVAGVAHHRELIYAQWLTELVLKQDFPQDPEGRVLEDALCPVFLEHQFADLASKTADEKVINALQKTWKKMTPAAQALAAKLAYSPRQKKLFNKVLKPAESNP